MPWDLSPFADAGLTPDLLESLLGEHETRVRPELRRLWDYYRNPADAPARRGSRLRAPLASGGNPGPAAASLAQASGLPHRLMKPAADPSEGPREIVIENDIAWRIDALVDFACGKAPEIRSAAPDPGRRAEIDAALDAAWRRSGGPSLLQEACLLACVYGSVDFVLREGPDPAVEIIEPTRAVPVLDAGDYRRLLAYVIHVPKGGATSGGSDVQPAAPRWFAEMFRRRSAPPDTRPPEVVEILAPGHRQVYDEGKLVVDDPLTLGELPVVHVQNAAQPFAFAGLSDVEPLIPLQDELNTRLSDRAHRVTLQSFNMFLARGIEPPRAAGEALRVAPGQVWFADNPDADIKAFGGDGDSPSETRHIDELREAMDKTSGVSPVVIGVIRERLGHLSSENALRLTLSGILSKTARKRQAFGAAIERLCRLVLASLDRAGTLRTAPAERGVSVRWPDPLPIDDRARLSAALMKRELGVPAERVLAELGYAGTDDPSR
ncbi:MAG: phage portal protein [Planctomycetota bacterium]|nr:phage portal protein [Planctomycetota bacterium]